MYCANQRRKEQEEGISLLFFTVRWFTCPILYLKKGPWNSHNWILVASENDNTALDNGIYLPNIKWDIQAREDNTPYSYS